MVTKTKSRSKDRRNGSNKTESPKGGIEDEGEEEMKGKKGGARKGNGTGQRQMAMGNGRCRRARL